MIRAAFIGCGGIAGAHVPGWRETHAAEAVEIVALCDVNDGGIDRLATGLGLGRVARYCDWEEMLANEELDAVDICLPHHLHAPAILAAAAKGVSVLCEKPLCMSLAEADRIREAVTRSGITLMCAHNQLFFPSVQRLRERIDQGVIGAVQRVFSGDCFRTSRTREEWGWRADLKTAGGGVLIDTGYHPTYRLLHLAGRAPKAVTAMMHNYLAPIDGEDTAHVLVRFEHDVMGQISTSWAFPMAAGAWQVEVYGTEGALFGRGHEYLHQPYQGEAESETLAQENGFAAEVKHFVDCLASGATPIQTHEDGIAVLKLILGAYESVETGRTVTY